mgnify:CR=1 FL=1
MKVELREIAFARSGDKGDTANIGVIAYTDAAYDVLVEELTARRVKRHFEGVCHGEVERYELPNLRALNFLLHRSLDGGGTRSLMLDAQGKTFSTSILRMEVDAPVDVLEEIWELREDRNRGGGEGASVTRRGAV